MLSILDVQGWITVLAVIAQLALAVLALVRRSSSLLALPFGVLCITLFGWNLSGLLHSLTRAPPFRHLDLALSPLSVATALHIAVVFVGRRRELRFLLGCTWVLFCTLSAASLAGLVWSPARSLIASDAWPVLFLACLGLALLTSTWLLIGHYRRTQSDSEEQNRTALMLAALLLGGGLAATELLGDVGLPVPRMGHVGTLLAAILLAVVVLRFRLLGREGSFWAVVPPLAVAAVAVLGYLAVFELFAGRVGAVVLGTATVTLLLALALRQIGVARTRQRMRRDRLTWLGRMSDQLAHDLKNPLAAIRGAVQFLEEEHRSGRPIDPHMRLVGLIGEQAHRLDRITDKYRRFGALEVDRRTCDLNALVERVIELTRHGALAEVCVRSSLEPNLPACRVDADLLAVAVENLLVNAGEACAEGARVWVSTHREDAAAIVSIRDEGAGMDARSLDRAFDELFTTKASGSGLGLPFVKRVVEAHGGRIEAESRPGQGTRVTLRLPF